MVPRAALTALLAIILIIKNVQGADSDVERVRNPFVSKHDLGQLMNNQNAERSFGRSIIPGFQRDSTFASNPSGCFSCTYGSGGSRSLGVEHLTAPKTTSTRRTYRKEQKFVNGQPVYDFHHEQRYQDGQLVHEDRHERGEDDVGVSAQNAAFNEQMGLGRASLQRNSQSSAFNNYQSSTSDLNRDGSNGYIIPQSSSTRREFRKEQKFVNGQPVYEQQHEQQFQDGQLVHEEKVERDENDFGVSIGNVGNIGQNSYSSTSRQSSSHLQSEDMATDFNADTARLRQKLQDQMRTFRMKPRLPTVGTSERSESRSESRYVNGQPVYKRNEEQRYKDGDLVHSNVEEKGAADFGTSHLINSAAHGTYATRGSGSYQGNREDQQQYQQSVSSSRRYPNSGSQQRTYGAVEQSQDQQRSTSYRPSYTPRGTSRSTQQSNQQSSTSYRPSYTPSRTVYSEETQRQESSTNHGYRPRISSTINRDESQQVDTSSSVSSSYPGLDRPTGSSAYGPASTPNSPSRNGYESHSLDESRDSTSSTYNSNIPYNRRTGSSDQSNYEESSQHSQLGQTYGSSSDSSYRPRGSSTTYREESQSQESGTYSASRPSGSNLASSVSVEGEDISQSSSYESPSITPSRRADGDKPAIYDHSYFARINADRRRGGNRHGSSGVYNGPRQVDLDLSETNGLNEHLVGTRFDNSQSTYDGSSQYSRGGSSYDRINSAAHGTYARRGSVSSSDTDSSYFSRSSSSESNADLDRSTVSNVNDNHIETEYDDYDETDEDYESHNDDYIYENTNSDSSYYDDENSNRLNKERYDISPYDGIEDIPEVNNEVETSYNPEDSHAQPEQIDYHNSHEEENHYSPEQHEQMNTGIPSYAYDNQDGNDRNQGYPQTSQASSPRPDNYPSYNEEHIPSVDHHQTSYDYSNNEVQQSSYPAVDHHQTSYDYSNNEVQQSSYPAVTHGGHESISTNYQESQQSSYPAVTHGGHESISTNYQESQEQSSIPTRAQYVPSSSSSHSSSRTNEERRENIYDSGAYGPGVVITSPHTKTRRTELRTKKKYVNGQLIGLTFYERIYENGKLVKENITDRGRDDLTQEELQQYGISMAEFDQPIYNEDGSYSQRQEFTQKKKFVNGQQIYDLQHERQYEDGTLVHENRTEKDEDDFGVTGYNRHGSSGYAVGTNTDTHEEAQGHLTNQHVLSGTVQHSSEDRQVTDNHIVNTVPHYTHRREEVRTQQKFVNGVPVYDLQHEKKYVDGQLVHENKTEVNEDEFRRRYGHRDALQDILAGQTLSTARDRNYENTGYYGSSTSDQFQSSSAQSGSSGQNILGGTQTVALDLGSAGHQSQSSYSNSSSYDSSSSYGSSGYGTGSQTSNGGAQTTVLDFGSAGSDSSTYGRGSHTAGGAVLTSVVGLGSIGSGVQGGQSSYSSSSSESEFQSSNVGASQMGTSLLSGHSSAGSGGARVATLDLGSSGSLGLGSNLLGSGGHQSQSSSYESGSSYGSSSSNSGSSGCVSCVISRGGGSGASAGLTGGHSYSQGHEMNKEERYENGELVHGQESERDFENGQLVREQSRQYGGRNAQQPSSAARTGHASSSSSYSSSSQSSYADSNGMGVQTTVTGANAGVCNNNPCGNGGTCIAGLRGALCVCTFGFKGKNCDEAYCPIRFCRYKGVCNIEDGQHICSCRDGHTGPRCATRARRHASKHRRRHTSSP